MRFVIRKFSAAKESVYSPLHPQSKTIRVLVLAPGYRGQPLNGNLINVKLNTGPGRERAGHKYDALSYCWGDDAANKSILIAGNGLNITPNLYDALQHLRSETVSYKIWIDQICINQEDTLERNRQVQQMDAIYARAREVIAWLGTATTESRVILGSLCRVDDQAFNEQLYDEGVPDFNEKPEARGSLWISICAKLRAAVLRHHSDLENANDWHDKLSLDFHTLLQNAWFQRMWIIQESVLPTRLFFQAGDDRISWRKLFTLLDGPWGFGAQLDSHQGAWVMSIRSLRAQTRGLTLGSLVSMFQNQKSKDPRDKVYALVGLAAHQSQHTARMSQHVPRGAPKLQVDYSKSVAQVFIDLVTHEVESLHDIRILSQCCSGRVCSLQGLPSWTDDWTQGFSQQSCNALLILYEAWRTNYKACGSHKAEAQYIAGNDALSVTGLGFDIVDETVGGRGIIYDTNGHESRQQRLKRKAYVSQESRSLALKPSSMDPYGTLEARINALCRTLILDRSDELRSDEPVSSDVVKAFVSVWDGGEVDFSDIVRSEGKLPRTKCHNFDDWWREFGYDVGGDRKLFRTKRGYFGVSCHHIEKGDKVCILWGGELPFILRESGTLDIPDVTEQEGSTSTRKVVSHKIVGGYCYIYGLAGGEGVEIAEKEGLAPQKIYIV